ncbi:MAG: TRAP transporter small permease [Desulfobacula sp.]|nr:TRAP transporter small permease [Desulfobacula sp.]
MPNKKNPLSIISCLQKLEDGILVTLLLVMIIMAVLQIVLRNLLDSGILWGDGLVKVLVLWIGLVGAMIASRNNNHISIDIISRYLPGPIKKLSDLIIAIFTTVICGIMAYFSFTFVLLERAGGMTAFAKVPAWLCESIIPIAFGIICFRYLILSFQTLIHIIKRVGS